MNPAGIAFPSIPTENRSEQHSHSSNEKFLESGISFPSVKLFCASVLICARTCTHTLAHQRGFFTLSKLPNTFGFSFFYIGLIWVYRTRMSSIFFHRWQLGIFWQLTVTHTHTYTPLVTNFSPKLTSGSLRPNHVASPFFREDPKGHTLRAVLPITGFEWDSPPPNRQDKTRQTGPKANGRLAARARQPSWFGHRLEHGPKPCSREGETSRAHTSLWYWNLMFSVNPSWNS